MECQSAWIGVVASILLPTPCSKAPDGQQVMVQVFGFQTTHRISQFFTAQSPSHSGHLETVPVGKRALTVSISLSF